MNPSLEWRLSVVLGTIIAACGVVAAALSFWFAFQEADEQQDSQLIQIASLVDEESIGEGPRAPVTRIDEDEETRVIILPLVGAPGASVVRYGISLPVDLAAGTHTVDIEGVGWRVFVHGDGAQRFAVAQRTIVRDEIAFGSGKRTLVSLLILIPLLVCIVRYVVRKAFASLRATAREVDEADASTMKPLRTDGMPSEVVPFADAINRLMARLRKLLDENRRFIADAAHELRSPVAALLVQADNVEHAEMSSDARHRLTNLRGGLSRMTKLLDQLLDLARQNADQSLDLATVQLDHVVRSAIEDILPLAQRKGLDLGVVRIEPAPVWGPQQRRYSLVRNAIDNAVRYSPASGTVDVAVWANDEAAMFVVEDTGPGLSDEELQRVFDPFYRVLGNAGHGSGLGLAIVKRVANVMGGSVHGLPAARAARRVFASNIDSRYARVRRSQRRSSTS